MTGEFTLDKYNVFLNEEIGKGGFGVVYKGKKQNGTDIAVKMCKLKTHDPDEEERKVNDTLKEIKNLQHLKNHPHIVQLYDFFYRKKAYWIIMEYCKAGDLDQFVCRNNPNLQEMINIMFQSASGINFMHAGKSPTVHRDIKPQNILVQENGDSSIVKITDFGLSKTVDITESVRTLVFNSKHGTQGYMAPEFFKEDKTMTFGKYVDVFSLGLVYLAMIMHKNGENPLTPYGGEFYSQLLIFC